MAIYAKTDPNLSPNAIVDIQILQATDPMNSAFIWTDITNVSPPPQIGWVTSDGGVTFTPPGLPYDAYGFAVTKITVAGHDIYTSASGVKAQVAAGAASEPAYLSIAIQYNLILAQAAFLTFRQSRYSDEAANQFRNMILESLANAVLGIPEYPNRMAYVKPLVTWANSVTNYLATYVTTVQALTNPATVASTVPDFSSLVSSDPLLSPLTAIAITN